VFVVSYVMCLDRSYYIYDRKFILLIHAMKIYIILINEKLLV
jgi:hypothetical protein